MKLFTFHWSKLETKRNFALVRIRAIDHTGRLFVLEKRFEEWMAICTNDIDAFAKKVTRVFRHCRVERLGDGTYRPTFPPFLHRVISGQFDYASHPFYKVYVKHANVYEAGLFFDSQHNVAYYEESQWLTRVYLDFYAKFGLDRFYYAWYDVDPDDPHLLSSFGTYYERDISLPPIGLASFDLETVPWEPGSDRFPNGFHPQDVIVMISLVVDAPSTRTVFYLLPRSDMVPVTPHQNDVTYVAFDSELELILTFLKALDPTRVLLLVGYNIVSFDLPCLLSRLAFFAGNGSRRASKALNRFTSQNIGKFTVASYMDMAVLDMYHFVLGFSATGLVNFKLDSVARKKLGHHKVEISPVAIHEWYQARDILDATALFETSVDRAFEAVVVARGSRFHKSLFGTYLTCLYYCYVDSQLVVDLVRHENALFFLVSRANLCTMNLEQVLYHGNSKYIESVLLSFGTTRGFFVDAKKFQNQDRDGDDCLFQDYAKVRAGSNKYQGALNYGEEMTFHRNVTCFDFESLYPSVVMCYNLSPETMTVVNSDRVLSPQAKERCLVTPFCVHDESDFRSLDDREKPNNKLLIVRTEETEGFFSALLKTIREMRRRSKRLMTSDPDNYSFHHNNQLMLKLIMNSMYGCFGSQDSCLSNMSVAMCVTFYARNFLLTSYRRFEAMGYRVPYCDTDSLFVVDAEDHLETAINVYLGHPEFINLQREARYQSLIIVSKKKYCMRLSDGTIVTKGFEKKSSELTARMVDKVLKICFAALEGGDEGDERRGWCLLQEILLDAFLDSRQPLRHTVHRKVKALDEYSERVTAPHVRLMQRLDNFQDRFIEFTYVWTDVSQQGDRQQNPCLPSVNGLRVDFEKLFVNQKKNILALLNVAFFKFANLKYLMAACNRIVQWMRWKQVVHANLVCKQTFDEDLLVCFKKDFKYTLKIVKTR